MKAIIFTIGLENSPMPWSAESPKALVEINGEEGDSSLTVQIFI